MKIQPNGIRAGVRIPVELPVVLRWKNRNGSLRKAEGTTGSMSGNGMLIHSPVRLRHDTPITFTVTFPADITKAFISLHGRGRVVRQTSPGSNPAFGAIIDEYEIRRSNRVV